MYVCVYIYIYTHNTHAHVLLEAYRQTYHYDTSWAALGLAEVGLEWIGQALSKTFTHAT